MKIKNSGPLCAKTYLVSIIDAKIVQEKFLEVDGNKIRYLDSGSSNKTLVLVHGLGASAERWSHVIPLFSKSFRVVVPDLVGFGYSDKPLVDYTPEFFSDFSLKSFHNGMRYDVTFHQRIGLK